MIRIGHGYDVHRMQAGRRLVLGGVDIPCECGLLGHSDADVVTHALMDAILGAMRAGDIGKLFPDTDPAYEGADSIKLLSRVAELARSRGYRILDCDCTIGAQAPKLAPYREQMRRNMPWALTWEASASRQPPPSVWALSGARRAWRPGPWRFWTTAVPRGLGSRHAVTPSVAPRPKPCDNRRSILR